MFYFARMCSKIRLPGHMPAEYFAMLGQGFDGRTCRYLEVRYDEVPQQVLAEASPTMKCWNGAPKTAAGLNAGQV